MSRKRSFSKKTRKMHKSKGNKNMNTTKRIFFMSKKQYRGRGGSNNVWETSTSQYPLVYGLDNKAVLFPISDNGIPAGYIDPPVPSNGPNGNGLYLGGRRKNMRNGKSMRKSIIKQKSLRKSIIKQKSTRKSMRMKGGGSPSTFAPQALVNLTRSLTGGIQETLNGFSGYTNSASLNPMPYDQPIDLTTKYLRTEFPNVEQRYNKANSYANSI